ELDPTLGRCRRRLLLGSAVTDLRLLAPTASQALLIESTRGEPACRDLCWLVVNGRTGRRCAQRELRALDPYLEGLLATNVAQRPISRRRDSVGAGGHDWRFDLPAL